MSYPDVPYFAQQIFKFGAGRLFDLSPRSNVMADKTYQWLWRHQG